MSETPIGGGASAGAIRATIDFDAAGLESAVNKAMRKATGQIEDSIDRSMADVQETMKSGFRKAGASIVGFLGLQDVAGTVRNVIGWVNRLGEETETAMNQFQAVSGATESQMHSVSETAKALGNDISLPGTSAADAAIAMTELAKAGFTVDESMAAAKGTLQLATAAQIDAGAAAEISSKQLQAFGLDVSKAGEVADILANAANATSADMQGMADSLNQTGAVAHASGISFTETAAAVALMADNAIVGSDAGTSLKAMLLALQAPTGKAAQIMSDLGIEVYDNQGRMKSLVDITRELTTGTAGLTDQQKQNALATIFGADAIRTVNVLMNQGADGLADMTKQLGQQGAAAKLAAANSQGLVGALGALQSTAESVAIEVYDKVSPALDEFLRGALDQLPGVLEDTGIYLGQVGDALAPLASLVAEFVSAAEPGAVIAFKAALAAALGVLKVTGEVLGPVAHLIEDNEDAFRSIVSAIVAATLAYKAMNLVVHKAQAVYTSPALGQAKARIDSLRTSVKSASTVVSGFRSASRNAIAAVGGPWGLAMAGAAIAIGIFANKHAEAAAHVDELVESLNSETGALTKQSRAAIAAALEDEGLLKTADELGVTLASVTDAAMGNEDSLNALADAYVETALHSKTLSDVEKNLIQHLQDEGKTSMEIFDQVKDHSHTRADSMLTDYYLLIDGARSESNAVGDARAEWDRKSRALEAGSRASETAAGSTKAMTGQVHQSADSLEREAAAADHAKRAIQGLNNASIKGLNAQIDFEQASDDLRATIKDLTPAAIRSGKALDIGTDAGRGTYRAFIDLANASEGVKGGMARARAQIFNTIRPMVGSKAEAERLTSQFFDLKNAAENVPHRVNTDVTANISQAEGAIARIKRELGSVPHSIRTDYYVNQVNSINKNHGVPYVSLGGVRGNAGGGAVYGSGTGTSDEVLRRLSNGEHVFTAKEVQLAGGQDNVYAMRAALRQGGLAALSDLTGGGGSLVDHLSIAVGTKDDLPEAFSEAMFHLRRIKRGSRYSK